MITISIRMYLSVALTSCFLSFQLSRIHFLMVTSYYGITKYWAILDNKKKDKPAIMIPNITLASAGDDIKLWNCDGFLLEKQFNPHSSNIASICWSHDNSVLTSASTGGDKLFMTYPNKSAFNYSIAESVSHSILYSVCHEFNILGSI